MDREQFYDYIKQLKNCDKKLLHPIDKALLLLEDYISIKWFNTLAKMGISYLTPCAIINSQEDWATYSNFGYNTILTICKKGFKIESNNQVLFLKNKVSKPEAIFRDKNHKTSIMLVFKHNITLAQYYKEIL